jgi:hyperosmotically inducible protein
MTSYLCSLPYIGANQTPFLPMFDAAQTGPGNFNYGCHAAAPPGQRRWNQILNWSRRLSMKATKYLSVVMMSFALLSVVGCASTRTQSSAGEYIDDTVITTKVKAAIFNDPDLKTREINVETFKGEVQLSGFVSTQSEINQAGTLARGVAGVTSVRNDIGIK